MLQNHHLILLTSHHALGEKRGACGQSLTFLLTGNSDVPCGEDINFIFVFTESDTPVLYLLQQMIELSHT